MILLCPKIRSPGNVNGLWILLPGLKHFLDIARRSALKEAR